ncbi:MAG: RagB/SusD family nutrient uptake outer membrane protein [Candidatus Pedobacter colombiensis]|uniref:RagB/SusD family nutrient uptake outer membrane protein n=1 Tax=Candidatus Pedobacter colombiensis TaxID=3121371 RepID=A0AAJ5WBM4_9SPHI|nr:RagB/SusD family nutrient uptake outer membrane protein [Pedobacter sp.]WEK21592.1 MAG: RagB/SusD family nutrient uptake outer membrane protein [Pedobacter sp.]
MKYYTKIIYGLVMVSALLTACNKDILDRPQLNNPTDNNYWRSETDVRLFANGFYTNYFVGYNSGYGVDYAPVRGYTFSDDLTGKNAQTNFESIAPATRASTSETAAWLDTYTGPTWNFSWVRKSNIFIDRLENVAKPKLTPEAYNHWMAVARFFRGFEYSRLVSVFGDVPYFDKVVGDTEFDLMYKDRDNRGLVMDKVYDDFKFVLANIRVNDGKNVLNKDITAAFISRFMLFEGTFQHYHNLDATRAKKYLELAAEAAQIVINGGQYNFTSDFKSLFTSENLATNKEVIMYRAYSAALGVTHSIGTYQNGTDAMGVNANLALIKSFICNDGRVWQNSTTNSANSFSIADLVKTRDPRFEASFIDKAYTVSSTLLYGNKFASREAISYVGKAYPPAWTGSTNTSAAPVMRLAEVVLNWIEAKAILAEFHQGPAITQSDLDKSINAIRNRPLDATAITKGVKKTAPLIIGVYPSDPSRDGDVSPLIWEIRRERHMEFVFEHTRLLDLKRWKKIRYMDFNTNQDCFLGPWVNIETETPGYLTKSYEGKVRVKKLDGTVVTYNGANKTDLIGFWMVENVQNRNAFGDEVYMAPVGRAQIVEYKEKGFTLSQTVNW